MKKLIIIIIITLVVCMGCVQPDPPKTYAVYSMDFGSKISGSFVLGSGSIDTDTYYYYYLQDMEGGYRLKKVLTDNTRIIMDKNITKDNAYVIIYNCRWCDRTNCPTVCETTIDDGAEFHVPLGTITREFNGNVRSKSSSDDSSDNTALTTYIATQYLNPSSPASPMYYHG